MIDEGWPMAGERMQRRLAAILAADMVGYSRLMGADEEGAKSLRQSLLDPKIEERRGRTVRLPTMHWAAACPLEGAPHATALSLLPHGALATIRRGRRRPPSPLLS
jgi:class 3 adenylate cyclase